MENQKGGKEGWRGKNGKIYVKRGKRENKMLNEFVEDGNKEGFEVKDDYKGEKKEGLGKMEKKINNGRRW